MNTTSCAKPIAASPADIVAGIPAARRRLSRVDAITPVDHVPSPSGGFLWIKREDRSRVHSFKWRGACNFIAQLCEEHPNGCPPVVTASAGNHAQGVALACARLGVDATIFMPEDTTKIKLEDVKRFGRDRVTVHLKKGAYDDAANAALRWAADHNAVMVPAFDHRDIITGQATIGIELYEQCNQPEAVYLPIGGGGLAAGVGSALNAKWPSTRIIGVEAEGQASMAAAICGGAPCDIGDVDRFFEGTAVRRVGDLTFALCDQVVDAIDVVTTKDVCAAMEFCWRELRCLPEPSGALSIAAALRGGDSASVAVVSGGNVDYGSLFCTCHTS